MSDAITWRSMTAPDFRSSAAIMSAGNESINQGINSLAALAKGYVDEQKGIAVSNAVADLSNTTNDADRRSVFDAHSANLKDHGIDLKDFITANQAKHTSLNADSSLKAQLDMNTSNMDMNKSTIAGNVLEQENQGIKNKTDQGVLDNQIQAFGDAHNTVLSNIANNNAQTAIAQTNANTNAAQANDAIAQNKWSRGLTAKTEADMAILYKELNNSENVIKDANGTPIGVDKKLALNKAVAGGASMSNLLKGDAAMRIFTDEAAKAEAAKTAAANKEKRDIASYTQNLKDASKATNEAKTSQKAAAVANSHWYTSAAYDASNAAAIDSAHGAQATTSDGKIIRLDPAEISDVIVQSSIPATFGGYGSGGELKTDVFLKNIKTTMANKVNLAEEKLKAAAKSK